MLMNVVPNALPNAIKASLSRLKSAAGALPRFQL